jgi:putative two-component system response regulator
LLPVVFLTGNAEADARVRAWGLDADDFLSKPFQSVEVAARCKALLRVKDLVDELDSAQAVVFSLARAIEAKSYHTQGHSERVTANALVIADQLMLSEADKAILLRGATLHDIGKISIPDEILNKPGSLTTDEIAVVRQHPMAGVRIVEPLRSVRDAIPIIRWHHERMDGGGYPDGLQGDAIPLLVRIVAVADVFDALSSSRPYRAAIPFGDCLEMLKKMAKTGGLDSEIVSCFCKTPAMPERV